MLPSSFTEIRIFLRSAPKLCDCIVISAIIVYECWQQCIVIAEGSSIRASEHKKNAVYIAIHSY